MSDHHKTGSPDGADDGEGPAMVKLVINQTLVLTKGEAEDLASFINIVEALNERPTKFELDDTFVERFPRVLRRLYDTPRILLFQESELTTLGHLPLGFWEVAFSLLSQLHGADPTLDAEDSE